MSCEVPNHISILGRIRRPSGEGQASRSEGLLKQPELFEENPGHPSLRLKKVHGSRPVYSVRITRDDRAVGIQKEESIIWFWVGSHSDDAIGWKPRSVNLFEQASICRVFSYPFQLSSTVVLRGNIHD